MSRLHARAIALIVLSRAHRPNSFRPADPDAVTWPDRLIVLFP
jgi:hypothetical protein